MILEELKIKNPLLEWVFNYRIIKFTDSNDASIYLIICILRRSSCVRYVKDKTLKANHNK